MQPLQFSHLSAPLLHLIQNTQPRQSYFLSAWENCALGSVPSHSSAGPFYALVAACYYQWLCWCIFYWSIRRRIFFSWKTTILVEEPLSITLLAYWCSQKIALSNLSKRWSLFSRYVLSVDHLHNFNVTVHLLISTKWWNCNKKISVILVGISLDKFNGYGYIPSTISLSYKIHFNALSFKHVVLGGNGKLWRKKLFYDQTFITVAMTW